MKVLLKYGHYGDALLKGYKRVANHQGQLCQTVATHIEEKDLWLVAWLKGLSMNLMQDFGDALGGDFSKMTSPTLVRKFIKKPACLKLVGNQIHVVLDPFEGDTAISEWIRQINEKQLQNLTIILLLKVTLLFGASMEKENKDVIVAKHVYQTPGIKDDLPVFRDKLADRMTYPLSWLSGNMEDFKEWRNSARAKVMECLLTPPPHATFDPVVIAEQDRGTYMAQKVVFNITGDSRVLGLKLIPKGEGPFPAVLLLHDHGARFDIGKEKVIKPWNVPQERMESAQEWVNTCYGGRWIGDELAKRGYVCLSTDALNWSDRGGAGYEGQQTLAGNLFHLGISFAGLIAHEDLRAAEFLASQPKVDKSRIAAMGLSMGSFRTWQVSALSEHISAGVAICWMATVKGLMVPGNNHTRGQSAFTMTHPGLYNYLDYPDVASIACPKPMLFYNGLQDGLFPVPSVKDAYEKMRQVWESQKAGNKLVTKLWDVPHEFNLEMQEEAFDWLDAQLNNSRR